MLRVARCIAGVVLLLLMSATDVGTRTNALRRSPSLVYQRRPLHGDGSVAEQVRAGCQKCVPSCQKCVPGCQKCVPGCQKRVAFCQKFVALCQKGTCLLVKCTCLLASFLPLHQKACHLQEE